MPNSFTFYKSEIREYFKDNVPSGTKMLDVGPGQGTYGTLLAGMGYDMDAVEVFSLYIYKFKLWEHYNNVYNKDIREFDWSGYDYIILGDILEHLTAEEGQKLISDIAMARKQCLVAVPYMMAQDGEEYGNSYETHHQPDLTPAVMNKRYPTLELIYGNEYYGYYVSKKVVEKAYVLYATEAYADIVTACVKSLTTFSAYPVFVYMLNSDVNIPNATTIRWDCDIDPIEYNTDEQFYINRTDDRIYNILIQRPLIVKDCLKYADVVCYVDSDSVATPIVDGIFNYLVTTYPMFTEGIYDQLFLNGRGDLEKSICEFLDIQRGRYIQTGYFLANTSCVPFLEEWANLCTNSKVIGDFKHYAPFHEETIANAVRWKYNITDSLPLVYTNASLDVLKNIDNYEYGKEHWEWFKLPKKDELFFYHGEKRPEIMYEMIRELNGRPKILFLAPHLSTGGMPAFLLKRIEKIKHYADIYVVEYQCHSLDFVVQRNAIKRIVGDNFTTLYENKMELFDVIDKWKPDIIHLDEPAERYNREMIQRLYGSDRGYKIVETFHDVAFQLEEKIFQSEGYAFCTPYHLNKFTDIEGYKEVIEFPIKNKQPGVIAKIAAKDKLGFNVLRPNVVNIGLWTPGKNQKEGLEIARRYPHMDFHFVGNQAGNFKDYWEPLMENLPENVKIWGERDDISTFLKAADIFMFNSTWECNPLVIREAVSYALPIVARNLPQYEGMFDNYILPIDSDLDEVRKHYMNGIVFYDISPDRFGQDYIAFYNKLLREKKKEQKIHITQYYVNNPFLEITGVSTSDFKVAFYDEQGVCHYESTIKCNSWVRLDRQWFTKWNTKIWQDGKLIYNNTLDYTGKRVFITIDSSSLGDTIAWIPYVEEFRKKHNCHVVVSTFKNFLFEKAYPELEFVEPGSFVNNIFGQYVIGWKYDSNREPEICNTIPLQKAATNILGLEYKEIKPKLAITAVKFNTENKFVTIATNSTSGCKFWTKEGWQEVINYLVSKGYSVYNVSKERNPFDNCTQIEDTSIDNTINMIYNSEFFIGLSSGLSWLAWAIDVPVVMISNFTQEDHEFKCIRVTNKNVCHGCWNNKNFKFDAGDYNWCPIWKGYDRQFECQNSITADMVIDKIKEAGF